MTIPLYSEMQSVAATELKERMPVEYDQVARSPTEVCMWAVGATRRYEQARYAEAGGFAIHLSVYLV